MRGRDRRPRGPRPTGRRGARQHYDQPMVQDAGGGLRRAEDRALPLLVKKGMPCHLSQGSLELYDGAHRHLDDQAAFSYVH